MTGNAMKTSRRSGFTLVELVVVVLILGILAAVAAPKMTNRAADARVNGTKQSLQVVRGALELYKQDNNGALPATATSLPTDLASYLTNGEMPTPSVGGITANTVKASASSPIVSGDVGGTQGYIYDSATGEIRVNHASYWDKL